MVGCGCGLAPSPEKEIANYYNFANRRPANVYNMTNVGEF